MASQQPDIILYTSGTPNGQKASITLEELGLPYKVENVQISKNVQKENWFLQINPNGRIPAIVDNTPSADGQPRSKRIFESGALMLYLCERYDKDHKLCYAYDTDQYWEVVEWLIWMQSGLGPMQVCTCLRPDCGNTFVKLATMIIANKIVGSSKPFLSLRTRKDGLQHQAISNRDQASISGARRPS